MKQKMSWDLKPGDRLSLTEEAVLEYPRYLPTGRVSVLTESRVREFGPTQLVHLA